MRDDVVSTDATPIKSALRNKPSTPSRLVKLDVLEEKPNEFPENPVPIEEEETEIVGSESDHTES